MDKASFHRSDWTGFEFTAEMIKAARLNADPRKRPRDDQWAETLWTRLRASGYVEAAIVAGGGEVD